MDFLKSIGDYYLFSVDQIFALTDSRGRRSLQGKIKHPYEKFAFASDFLFPKNFKKRIFCI